MARQFFVYMLANKPYGTLYTGVTSNLTRRVFEHRNELREGFTQTYQIHRLVWCENHADALSAIQREKQIKKWRRDWKIRLIEESNPDWADLYGSLAAQM